MIHPTLKWFLARIVVMIVAIDILCVQSFSSNVPKITFRKAKQSDLPEIANLLIQTFDVNDMVKDSGDPSVVFGNNIPTKSKEMYVEQLGKRMTLPQHILIVGVSDDGIIGFMELGTMPSPISTRRQISEYPFLANLAVDAKFQRQKVGTKLVQLAVKIATKWCTTQDNNLIPDAAMYLAVEKDNLPAVSLYDRLHFSRVVDETKKLDTETINKLQRKPRLYFEKKLRS